MVKKWYIFVHPEMHEGVNMSGKPKNWIVFRIHKKDKASQYWGRKEDGSQGWEPIKAYAIRFTQEEAETKTTGLQASDKTHDYDVMELAHVWSNLGGILENIGFQECRPRFIYTIQLPCLPTFSFHHLVDLIHNRSQFFIG